MNDREPWTDALETAVPAGLASADRVCEVVGELPIEPGDRTHDEHDLAVGFAVLHDALDRVAAVAVLVRHLRLLFVRGS